MTVMTTTLDRETPAALTASGGDGHMLALHEEVARTRPAFSLNTWRLGRLYFSSDWHLGHERIIPLCRRPFASVEEMNSVIIENINSVVTARDSLVLLGDTLMGKIEDTLPLLKQLRAKRIWLIPGNHDRFSLAFRHLGSSETQRIKRGLWRSQYESQRKGIRAETDQVPSSWAERVGGRQVLLSHYPYGGDSQVEDRHRWLRPKDTGLPLIHGHVHEKWRVRGPMFNVGVDANDFMPVAEEALREWLSGVPLGGGSRARTAETGMTGMV